MKVEKTQNPFYILHYLLKLIKKIQQFGTFFPNSIQLNMNAIEFGLRSIKFELNWI